MSLTNLYNRLTGQATISLNQSGLGDDGQMLFPLLPELSEATITLTVSQGPAWEDATQSKFTITGTSQQPLLGMAAPSITFDAIANGNDIQFRMQIETVAGWTFGTSFPQLASTELNLFSLSNALFILTTLDSTGEQLLKGLNFKGYLQLTNTSILPAIEEFITGAAASLPVAGTVQKYEHYQLITIKAQIISGNASFSVADLLSFQFSAPDLALYAYIYSGGPPVALIKRIESNVTLSGASGSPVTLPLALQLPTLVTGWLMMLQPDQKVSLADFLEFLALLGSAGQFDLIGLFTGELGAIKEILKALLLKSFSVEIIGSLKAAPQFRSFSFQVQQQENTPWQIIPNRLELANLQVSLRISKEISSYNTAGFIQGELGITDSIAINAMIPVPIGNGDWQFFSRHPIALTNIEHLSKFTDNNPIGTLLPASLGDVGGLELAELGLIYDPSAVQIKQLEFAVTTKHSWVIVPDQFEIISLYLHFTIEKGSQGWGLSGNIQGELLAGGMTIDTQIQKPVVGSDWYFSLHANAIPLPSLEDLSTLVGGKNALNNHLPKSLLTAQLYLDNPRIDFNLSQRKLEAFGFALITDEIDFNEVKILQACVDVEISFLSQPADKKIKIYGLLTIADIDFYMESEYSGTGGWQLMGQAGLQTPISVGNLIADLVEKFGHVSPPDPIKNFTLQNLAISFNTKSKDFTFSGEADFSINSTLLDITTAIAITRNQDDTFDKNFTGHLFIGQYPNELQFDLIFDKSPTATLFLAAYNNPAGDSIDLSTLLNQYLPDAPLPAGLSITLKDAVLAYESLESAKKVLFALHIGNGINLSNLPLVGKMFPPGQTIKLAYQIVVASATFDKDNDVPKINALMPEGIAQLPTDKDIKDRLGLTTSIQFGSETIQLSLPVAINNDSTGPDPVKPISTTTQTEPTSTATASSTSTSDSAKWFNLQKSFGPVHFERIGVKYQDQKIWFLLDAALSLGGGTLSLDGLAIGSPLTKFEPEFDLKGLGIDFHKGPLEIGGAFLRQHIKEENGREYDEYDGLVVLKSKQLSISALGSYAYVNGHPSLFIYGLMNYPFGGPAFFFVTGAAAGFGYNRALRIPTVSQVAQFPLVEEAVQGQAMSANANRETLIQELEKLHQYVSPSTGQMFLAIGIKFTSFKLIDSFALLAISLGNRVELDILGLSTLLVPPNASTTPLAEVQMALKATFVPDEGFLSIRAQLTPASYVLSKNCHLTGEFAFYTWFSGTHEGDFVISLGGYHPSFKVPVHYPTVPRLRLNWQIDSHTSFKGDLYYALCPHTLMAGGHLEALYHRGHLKAWFKAGADFLIAWKPYHYDAKMYVEIGASYTYHFFGTHHITADLGADLHLWGPEFGGHATIHIWVVSVGVDFGDQSSQRPQPIDWENFKESFLPKDNEICSITVKDGLVTKGDDTSDLGVINPKHFSLVTNSVIPSNKAQLKDTVFLEKKGSDTHLHHIYYNQDQEQLSIEAFKMPVDISQADDEIIEDIKEVLKALDNSLVESQSDVERLKTFMDKYDMAYAASDTDSAALLGKIKSELTTRSIRQLNTTHQYPVASHGISSMAVMPDQLTTTQTITITKKELISGDEQDVDVTYDFAYTPILKKMPAGLWGQELTPSVNGEPFIENALAGFEITPAEAHKPGKTQAIDRRNLRYTTDSSIADAYGWASLMLFTADTQKDKEDINQSILAAETVTNRNALLTQLGFDTTDNLIDLNETVANDFLVAPQVEKI
jgi:hypothetical protein